MITYFDIETIPTIDPGVISELSEGIKPPGTIKKAESIKAWMDENSVDELLKKVSKTSLDGMYGRVACISWAFDDNEILSTTKDMNEHQVLAAFFESADDSFVHSFCGHNITGFDLPFLKHRAMILGAKPPKKLLEAMNSKSWDKVISDTMLMWSQDKQKMVSMDKLCKAFGIEGKGDFDGSMVAETWPVDPQKVIDYCDDDVNRTRQIYKRMTFSCN